MGLTKIGAKLDSYFSRLDGGKAAKIKPKHVEKMIDKLEAKQALLLEEIETADSAAKKDRLKFKLSVAEDQIKRAEWLLREIGSVPKH